ncbi:MAG TPA: hypothetical protein VFX15_02715 [Actinomycetes bacterium]|nr:hypothetical protein [Actinomycetes bacterium]
MNLWQIVVLPYALGILAVVLFIASMLTTGWPAFWLSLFSAAAAVLAVGELFVLWRLNQED